MQMKLMDVLRHQSALRALGKMSFPAKLNFAIAHNLDALTREVERVENERVTLCLRYADKDADGKPVMVESVVNNRKVEEYRMSDENRAEFAREYRELLDTEVDVEIRTAGQELIERCEESERYSILTVEQLAGMSFMIDG